MHESKLEGPNRRGRPLGRWKARVEEYLGKRSINGRKKTIIKKKVESKEKRKTKNKKYKNEEQKEQERRRKEDKKGGRKLL